MELAEFPDATFIAIAPVGTGDHWDFRPMSNAIPAFREFRVGRSLVFLGAGHRIPDGSAGTDRWGVALGK